MSEPSMVVNATGTAAPPITEEAALIRMYEAEDTLRAIGEGEVDAFVVGDAGRQRVFTLSTADRPYRIFVENMRDGAATLSSDGLILYANRRLADLLACSTEDIVGSPLAQFVVGGLPLGFAELRGPHGLGAALEMDLADANGVSVPVLVGSAPLEPDEDHLTCLTFTDLTTQKAQDRRIALLNVAQTAQMADLQGAQAALVEQATHDWLTGLPNRALVVDRIDQALLYARRSGRCTAVLFVDLDRFKNVNDTRGHAGGDAVLKRVAEQLVAAVRPMDTVARIGGDEFVILAPEVDNDLHAVGLSARVVEALCSHPVRAGDTDRVTASVGVTVSMRGVGSAESLLQEADTAMYEAKARGGACAAIFDSALGRLVTERAATQQMLQTALDDRRIVVHYQPVVDISTGGIAGFEALARVRQRDGSMMAPAAFIVAAEDSGLVVPLGAQVLDMAGTDACGWQKAGMPPSALTVAVNVSARQLWHGDLADVVGGMLAATGLEPSRLHLELTETAVIDVEPEVLRQLNRIRDLGVEIGLDDFGTGYASLTHLRRLPLSFVKIDQSFVKGLNTDSDDERIVAAVVDLAAHLGRRSIAEGVEYGDQLNRLRELGCDQAQGFFFSPGVPSSEVSEVVEHWVW